MHKVFIGTDPRQPVAYQVLVHSIGKFSTVPVSITPLKLRQLPIKRCGLTEFTYARWLVPYLCGYKGTALFLDADILVRGDLDELFKLAEGQNAAVSVSKNKLRFEWPSVMLFNCEHPDCKTLTPEYIDDVANQPATFAWTKEIGELPSEWNHLIGYDERRPDAKIIHYTMGIPCWPETVGCEYSDEWNKDAYESMSTVTWQELMGTSVHAKHIDKLKMGST